jgi:hypothetical protein
MASSLFLLAYYRRVAREYPKKKDKIIDVNIYQGDGANVCANPSSTCRSDPARGWVCALPGQTEVVCSSTPPVNTAKANLDELLSAVKLALSLSGFGNVATSIDTSEKSLSISADVAEGKNENAINRAKEAIVSLSTAGLKGAGGLLSIFSEPEIIDGKLMMKVRLPFIFLKPQDSENNL